MTLSKLFFFIYLFLFCIVLDFALVSKSASIGSLITSLPGFNGTFPSKHYSGYIALEDNLPQNLFYYFMESEKNPSKDPVVLWLNGGPGCSSMDGFVYEHGPFDFRAGETHHDLPTLQLNEFSWSKVSNIIYLDSPVGVGFSYSEKIKEYTSSDTKTASFTRKFILKWFEEFPEFSSNPFYITGESYAGIYIPTLASEILKGAENDPNPKINLKGYMIGNGVTGSTFDENAFIPFVHGMRLISDDINKEVETACEGKYYSPSKLCNKMLDKVDKLVNDLNIYNILEPCFHYPDNQADNVNRNKSLPISFRQLGKSNRPLPVRTRMFGRAWPFRAHVRNGPISSWPKLIADSGVPCYNDIVATKWLDDVNVRRAINAATEIEIGPWELCSDKIDYDHDTGNMIPYHKKLTAQGIRVLIYSGDHDMCVPFTGTQAWTHSLGYKITDNWRPWISSNNQVAGFVQGYSNNFTFLTIKGAGHTVPEYKPREAFDFYSRWLEGRPI